MFHLHFDPTVFYYASGGVGTVVAMLSSLRSGKLRSFISAFFQRAGNAWSVANTISDLQSAKQSQATALEAASTAAEQAMKAVEAIKARVETLEDQHRNLMYYYNLVLNYCSRLLDYAHELRAKFKELEPDVVLPDIPEQPDLLPDARHKYADFEANSSSEKLT